MTMRYLLAATLAGTLLACAAQAELTAKSCTGIVGLTYPDLRIAQADYVSGDSAIIAEKPYPDHCVVTGFLEERVGTDGQSYATGFELRLPQDWNGRFFFQGGGGIDGSIRPAVGTNTGHMPDALTLGYATASTDGGHNLGSRGDVSFGAERKALIDYGYNSVELVGTTSKAIIREAYGAHAAFSYFVGFSNGGRQGLQSAMRTPNLFDGIVAGAPIKQQTRGHVATAWSLHVLGEIAPKDDQGRPLLSNAYSQSDMDAINAAIIAQCDALDGLEDGVVDSAKMCDVDLSSVVCSGDTGEGCVSQDQADAYDRVLSGPVNSSGDELYAPYPYDAGSDFVRWHLGDAEEWPNNGRKARNRSITMVFRQPADPSFDPWQFDFDTDVAPMDHASQFVDAKSADLDAFALGGGKLIVYHSIGDSGPSAMDTARWFETVQGRYGPEETGDFAQFYLLTGIGHSRSSGIGPTKFPALDAVVAWVEEGTVPEMEISGGTPERTRPMCAYPTYVMWDATAETWGCE
ncbi:MAG: tannase/feruloyl esterase family alpha/beta hydrolase [Paracoccaceae bacterium]